MLQVCTCFYFKQPKTLFPSTLLHTQNPMLNVPRCVVSFHTVPHFKWNMKVMTKQQRLKINCKVILNYLRLLLNKK